MYEVESRTPTTTDFALMKEHGGCSQRVLNFARVYPSSLYFS